MDLRAKQARIVALPAETSDTCDEPGDDGVLDDADTLVSVDRTTTRLMTPSRSATPAQHPDPRPWLRPSNDSDWALIGPCLRVDSLSGGGVNIVRVAPQSPVYQRPAPPGERLTTARYERAEARTSRALTVRLG